MDTISKADRRAIRDWAVQQRDLEAGGGGPLADSTVADWVASAREAGDDDLIEIVDRVGLERAEEIYAERVAELRATDWVRGCLSDLDDGTGDLGIVARQALRDDPDATAQDVRAIWCEASQQEEE